MNGPAFTQTPNNTYNYGRRQFKNFTAGNVTATTELTLSGDPQIEKTAQVPVNWALVYEDEGQCRTDNRNNVRAPGGTETPQRFIETVDFPYIFQELRGRGFEKVRVDVWDVLSDFPHSQVNQLGGLGIQYQMGGVGETQSYVAERSKYLSKSLIQHPEDTLPAGTIRTGSGWGTATQLVLAFGFNNVSNEAAYGSAIWHNPDQRGGGVVYSTGVHQSLFGSTGEMEYDRRISVLTRDTRTPIGFRFVFGGEIGDFVLAPPLPLEWKCTFKYRIYAMP